MIPGDKLIELAENHEYKTLFLRELLWNKPDAGSFTATLDDGESVTVTNIAQFDGIRVWVCPRLPSTASQVAIDRLAGASSTNRLVIFHDGTDQVWRWPVRRDSYKGIRLASHRHHTGDPNPSFGRRLAKIQLSFDEDVTATDLLIRLREAFDVDAKSETRRASRLMANLYTTLEDAYRHYPRDRRAHEISVTLARVLFLVFGDDTDMWQPDRFRNFLYHQTRPDGTDLADRLNTLFSRLNTPGDPSEDEEMAGFKYVNGGIFAEDVTLPGAIGTEFRSALLEACTPDWSSISPAIFGSMFQSVRDAATRHQLGEHYTSEENILKTLNPLFLDELRAEYAAAMARGTRQKKINALQAMRKRLANIRFLDPACGCGNFIIVAYRELRDLELLVNEQLAELQGTAQQTLGGDMVRAINVTLDHFAGIEIDEWPATIARTAMFLTDRQCDLKLKERFGLAPERLPIHSESNIMVGNALRMDWNVAMPQTPGSTVVVAGNPPFLGHASRTSEQADDLRRVWGKSDISRLDYVTGWYAKALDYFGRNSGLWAFVSTNSITQGDPVPHLFKPIFGAGWRIKFAHQTFPWTSEAAKKAAVHCVIVGFTRESGSATLFVTGSSTGTTVPSINAYLVDGPLVFAEKRSIPIGRGLPVATFGNMPRDEGHLVVEPEQYADVASDPIAAKYLRPFMGAEELLHGKQRWCLWLVGATEQEIASSEVLSSRVDAVRKFRKKSSASSTRAMAATPHLFGQRPALYDTPYLIIPSVSSEARLYFPAARVGPETIASNAAFTASDADGLAFAVISSSMFITWQRATGGRLESRLRFSSTISWANFPLPAMTEDQRVAVIQAGKGVLLARELQPELTLAQSYDPLRMSPALVAAHDVLDVAIDGVFGVATRPDAGERLAVLFDYFARLSGADSGVLQRTARR